MSFIMSLFPPSHTNKTHILMHAHTPHTGLIDALCHVRAVCDGLPASQKGDGSMGCCSYSLSMCLSMYSHILSSTGSSSLLLLQFMGESPSNLEIGETVINLIHLNLLSAVHFDMLYYGFWFCLPVHYKHRGALKRKRDFTLWMR